MQSETFAELPPPLLDSFERKLHCGKVTSHGFLWNVNQITSLIRILRENVIGKLGSVEKDYAGGNSDLSSRGEIFGEIN